MENATDGRQNRKRSNPRRLAWGLMIAAGLLLSVNLYDSIQYYLGHRMTDRRPPALVLRGCEGVVWGDRVSR